MELTGIIEAVLPLRSGQSKSSGKPWTTGEYVIQYVDGQFSKHMMFTIFGEDKIAEADLHKGDNVTVFFDVDAREFNGRWYNDIRCYKVNHNFDAPREAPEPEPQEPNDGLPF